MTIVRKKGPSCEFQNTVPERTFPPQKPFTLKGIGNDDVACKSDKTIYSVIDIEVVVWSIYINGPVEVEQIQ